MNTSTSLDFVTFLNQEQQVDKNVLAKINHQNIHFQNERNLSQYKQTFILIKEWRIKKLSMYQNDDSSLLKQIQHVCFPSLTWLSLSSNKIESIEGINRIYMPMIQKIYLYNNRISTVAALKKTNWKALNQLDLFNNEIRAVSFTQISFPSPQLFWELSESSSVQCEDIRELMKWDSVNSKLYLKSKKRIVQPSFGKILKMKYQLKISSQW